MIYQSIDDSRPPHKQAGQSTTPPSRFWVGGGCRIGGLLLLSPSWLEIVPCTSRSSRRTTAPGLTRPLTTAPTAEQQGEEDSAFQRSVLRWLSERRSPQSSPPLLTVGPSTIPGAGRGLFLAPGSGVQPKGTILTLYPGLTYQLPIDVEPLQHVDEAMAGPPDFMLGNAYLLRVGLPFTVQRYVCVCMCEVCACTCAVAATAISIVGEPILNSGRAYNQPTNQSTNQPTTHPTNKNTTATKRRKGGGSVRITDDFLVDAQPWGLSAQLFRAVVARRKDLPGHVWGRVNDAWLEGGGEGGRGEGGASQPDQQQEQQEQQGEGGEWKRRAKCACALGHVMNDPQGSVTGRPNVVFKVCLVSRSVSQYD
jgi:hypothetical protein